MELLLLFTVLKRFRRMTSFGITRAFDIGWTICQNSLFTWRMTEMFNDWQAENTTSKVCRCWCFSACWHIGFGCCNLIWFLSLAGWSMSALLAGDAVAVARVYPPSVSVVGEWCGDSVTTDTGNEVDVKSYRSTSAVCSTLAMLHILSISRWSLRNSDTSAQIRAGGNSGYGWFHFGLKAQCPV